MRARRGAKMKRGTAGLRHNLDMAKTKWGELSPIQLSELGRLIQKYKLSISLGDIQYLARGWYITHAGLLRLAHRRRCAGIGVRQVGRFCDPVMGRWVFKATVFKSPGSKGFVGYGDADPSNVSSLVHGTEMRVAETRAVNRALRKAYGIGLCSVEELGSSPRSDSFPSFDHSKTSTNGTNGHRNGDGQPRLRDRLCLLIR